jgi:hypothetical protein
LSYGVPKAVTVSQREVAECLLEPVGAIAEAVKLTLEHTAPELAGDIIERGILLTGGGALLENLDVVLRQITGLPVSVAENPLACVALGTGRALEEMKALNRLLINIWLRPSSRSCSTERNTRSASWIAKWAHGAPASIRVTSRWICAARSQPSRACRLMAIASPKSSARASRVRPHSSEDQLSPILPTVE